MRRLMGVGGLGRGWVPALLGLAVSNAACELDEVSLTEPETALVAEVYVTFGDGPDQVLAFLQWTLGGEEGPPLQNATIRLTGPRDILFFLVPASRSLCLQSDILDDVAGTCFLASDLTENLFRPGDHLEVEISVPGGGELRGAVTLPGDFSLRQPEGEFCALPPGVPLEMIWAPAKGAWAYNGEALLRGLKEALAPDGILVEKDSLNLVGLAIAESDTTMVFPQEFGVFDRFDLDRDLALALQEGLPQGATAEVSVAALERNYVNWIRGGNFNPSGAVRIPSLLGDGIGVVAGALRRSVQVVGTVPDAMTPPCLPGS